MEKNGCKNEKKTGAVIEKCARIGTYYRNERALRKIDVSTGTTNVMAWPVNTLYSISAYFRDPSYYRLT